MAQRQAAKSLVDDAWETVTPTPTGKRSMVDDAWETVPTSTASTDQGTIGAKPSLATELYRSGKAKLSGYAADFSDFLKGGGKGVLSKGLPIARTIGTVPKNTTLEDVGLNPTNSLQSLGMGAEEAGEYFLPEMAATKALKVAKIGSAAARLALRAAIEGGGTAAVSAGQGQSPTTGAIVGAATPLVGAAAEPIVKRLPAAIVNYAIRPMQKQFRFGKNPGQGIVDEGIVALSNSRLLDKANTVKKSLGAEIGGKLKNYSGNQTVDVMQHLQPIDDAIQEAVKHNDQQLVEKLNDFRKTLTDKLALDPASGKIVSHGTAVRTRYKPSLAAELKQNIGEGTRWTGEGYEKPLNQAKAGVYRSLRDEIGRIVPDVNPLNHRYSNILEATKAAEHKEGLNNLFRFGDLGIYGAGLGIGAATGDTDKGLGVAGLLKLMSTTGGSTLSAQLIRRSPGLLKALRNVTMAGQSSSSSR